MSEEGRFVVPLPAERYIAELAKRGVKIRAI
jgi:hypothetical protein